MVLKNSRLGGGDCRRCSTGAKLMLETLHDLAHPILPQLSAQGFGLSGSGLKSSAAYRLSMVIGLIGVLSIGDLPNPPNSHFLGLNWDPTLVVALM